MATLKEIMITYQANADTIHTRILELRQQEKACQDPDEAFYIHHRINVLIPIWREAREAVQQMESYCRRGKHGP